MPCPPASKSAPSGNVLVLWPFHRVWPQARPLLELARPAGVMLHGSAEGLVALAAEYASKIRDELTYQPDIWLGIGADGDKNAAVERWAAVAELAVEIGAATVQINAEGTPEKQWTADHAEMITAAYAAMREEAPDLPIGHTSWYSHALFPRYPWTAFVGEGGADYTHPQVYLPNGSRSGLMGRHAKSKASYGEMRSNGALRANCDVEIYLEAAEDNDAAGTLTLAPLYDSVCWWAFVREMDAQGRRSVVGACLLRRLGYHGADGITRFQRESGLTVDGWPAKFTQRALGLP
ncbi:MAG: hypothetical protein V3V34_11710 [Kiloniellales bacterium]